MFLRDTVGGEKVVKVVVLYIYIYIPIAAIASMYGMIFTYMKTIKIDHSCRKIYHTWNSKSSQF